MDGWLAGWMIGVSGYNAMLYALDSLSECASPWSEFVDGVKALPSVFSLFYAGKGKAGKQGRQKQLRFPLSLCVCLFLSPSLSILVLKGCNNLGRRRRSFRYVSVCGCR